MQAKDNEYCELAREALQILDVRYDETASLKTMISYMRNVYTFPASTTEAEIRTLAEQIARELEMERSSEEIRALLEKLDSEVSYLPFD